MKNEPVILDDEMTDEENYDHLSAAMSGILQHGKVEIDDKMRARLRSFDITLRTALGLPT